METILLSTAVVILGLVLTLVWRQGAIQVEVLEMQTQTLKMLLMLDERATRSAEMDVWFNKAFDILISRTYKIEMTQKEDSSGLASINKLFQGLEQRRMKDHIEIREVLIALKDSVEVLDSRVQQVDDRVVDIIVTVENEFSMRAAVFRSFSKCFTGLGQMKYKLKHLKYVNSDGDVEYQCERLPPEE